MAVILSNNYVVSYMYIHLIENVGRARKSSNLDHNYSTDHLIKNNAYINDLKQPIPNK